VSYSKKPEKQLGLINDELVESISAAGKTRTDAVNKI